MALRQALVAVKESHEGPWQCSRGSEIGIKISGLGVGEVVIMEGMDSPIIFHQNGTFPFPKVERFRFLKQASLFEPGETFVQVVLK